MSDTGPLISLEKLDKGYEFIRLLYDQIIVPPKVIEEVAENYTVPSEYLRRYGIEDLIHVQTSVDLITIPEIHRLHQGEAHAISLAVQLNLPVLLEEIKGRALAHKLNLKFSGIAAQIVSAYQKNLITQEETWKKLQELFQKQRINREVYNLLIQKTQTQ